MMGLVWCCTRIYTRPHRPVRRAATAWNQTATHTDRAFRTKCFLHVLDSNHLCYTTSVAQRVPSNKRVVRPIGSGYYYVRMSQTYNPREPLTDRRVLGRVDSGVAGDKRHYGNPLQLIMSQRKGIGDAAGAAGCIGDCPPRHLRERRWGETSQGPGDSGVACGKQASGTPTHPNNRVQATGNSLRSFFAPAISSA